MRPRDRISRNVRLDADLVERLEVLLADPLRGGLRYGAFSDLINALLREWLERTTQEEIHEQSTRPR